MSDSQIYSQMFAPIVSSFSKKFISYMTDKVENIEELVSEQDLCDLFFQCMIGGQPIQLDAKQAAKQSAKQDEEVKEPSKRTSSKPLCQFENCTTHVMKTDRNIEGNFYCAKHIKHLEKLGSVISYTEAPVAPVVPKTEAKSQVAKAEKAEAPECCYVGCTTRCKKAENVVEGNPYCSKHIKKAQKEFEEIKAKERKEAEEQVAQAV